MRILCETSVHYRLANNPSSGARLQKSTIALGHHPPNKEQSELFMILFTQTNKTGTRYAIQNNIERVHTKFVDNGKATLALKQPAIDIQLRCDTVQLKCFLQALKLGIEGRITKDAPRATLATVAIPQKSMPVTKLQITSRSQYPVRGLPKTLTSLSINGIQRCRFDSQILFMKSLSTLDLSNNLIEELPKQLGQMRLRVLNMSKNQLGSEKERWQWLTGTPLKENLQHLNLAENQLKYVPINIVRLQRLVELDVSKNSIERIPFAMRRLKFIKTLCIADNNLRSLPSTMNFMKFATLDLFCNKFGDVSPNNLLHAPIQMQNCASTLTELASRSVFANRIRYNARSLPQFLINLLEETPLCQCGLICFSGDVHQQRVRMNLKSDNIIMNSSSQTVLGDTVFCSARCFKKYSISPLS